MKKLRKIILGLLTLVLSFGLVNVVSASGKGSILVNGTTSGKTYEIYKIFDLTYSGSKVAYTIDSDWEDFFNGDGSAYLVNENTGSLNAITVGNTTKYINVTSSNIEEFTQNALEYATGLEFNDGSQVATGESLTFDNLDLGYYLVYPQGATDIIIGNGSICSITSTVPNATVNIKAGYPTIDKIISDANTDVGQLVEFTVTGLVPDTTGYRTYLYKIDDTMTAGLEFNSEIAVFSVMFGETAIDVVPEYNDNGFTLSFDMVDYQDYVGEVITIKYSAKVTEEAVNSSTTKNSVTLTYSNNPKTDSTFVTVPIEVYVYSSEINVTKVDANSEDIKLAGASFVLKNLAGLYYRALDGDGNLITDTTSTENVDKVEWISSMDNATLLVTDESGVVTFEGVENGTYYLVEVEAPDGYNKLTGPVTVKVGYTDESGTNLGTVAVSHEEVVENNSGTVLPHTGGIGSVIFIVVGSLLTLVSAIILLTNKRMSREF